MRSFAIEHDHRLRSYYAVGVVAVAATRAGVRIGPRERPGPFLRPAGSGQEMLHEAERHLVAAPRRKRAAMLHDFVAQIHGWFGGHWFYYLIPRPPGEALVAGTIGHARWVDAKGRLWKGLIRNLYDACRGEEVVWENLEPVRRQRSDHRPVRRKTT
jgi:hypothetical protein